MTLFATMVRISDPERFQKIASGIQAILVSLAVIIGGAWTLYTFNSQLQVENAQAQVQKLKREIEAEPKVEVSIQLQQLQTVKRNQYVLAGVVAIKNTGNITTALLLDDNPVTIFEVNFRSDGKEEWIPVRNLPLRASDQAKVGALVAHSGAINSIPFTTYVDQPGIYVARFSAQRRQEEATTAILLGAKPKGQYGRIEWANHSYVVVK